MQQSRLSVMQQSSMSVPGNVILDLSCGVCPPPAEHAVAAPSSVGAGNGLPAADDDSVVVVVVAAAAATCAAVVGSFVAAMEGRQMNLGDNKQGRLQADRPLQASNRRSQGMPPSAAVAATAVVVAVVVAVGCTSDADSVPVAAHSHVAAPAT